MKVWIRKSVRTTLVILLIGWGAFEYANHAIMDAALERIQASGFAEGATVDVHGAWTIDVSKLTLEDPVTAGPFQMRVHVDHVRVVIDPWALAQPGLPLGGSIEVTGVAIDVALSNERQPQTIAAVESSRSTLRQAIVDRMERACPAKCRLDLRGIRLQTDIDGLSMGNYDQLHGTVDVHGNGSVTMAIRGPNRFASSLTLDLADATLNPSLDVQHPKPVTLDLNEPTLKTHLPAVRKLQSKRLHAQLDRIRVEQGDVHLHGLQAQLDRDADTSVTMRLESLTTDLTVLRTQGVRDTVIAITELDTTLYHQNERHASLHVGHTRLGDTASLFGCHDRPICTGPIDDLSFWARSPSDETRTVSGSIHRLESCGPTCNRALGFAFESHDPTGSAQTQLERLEAEWRGQAVLPHRVHAERGHVQLTVPGLTPLLQTMGLNPDLLSSVTPVPSPIVAPPPPVRTVKKKKRRWKRKKRIQYPDLAQVLRQWAIHHDQHFAGLLTRAFSVVDRWQEATHSPVPKVDVNDVRVRIQKSASVDPYVDAKITQLTVSPWSDGPMHSTGDVHWTFPKSAHLTPEELTMSVRADRPGFKVSGRPLRLQWNGHVDREHQAVLSMTAHTPHVHLSHRKIASSRIDFPPATITARVTRQALDPVGVAWQLDKLRAEAQAGATAHASVKLHWDNSEEAGLLQTTVALPMQDCARLHHSVPAGMLPGLHDAEFQGQARIALTMTTPLSSIDTLGIDFDADFSGCKAVTLGPHYSVKALNRNDTVFEVHDPKLSKPVKVGPGTRSWTRHIPRHIIGSALATEDGAFFSHKGFALTRLVRGFRLNLRTRRYLYGGSSITQQLVKNIFLKRTKTLARKLEEAVLVWQVERHVPKKRIIRLYLNCIEYGPNIYGIRRAARAYFKTGPSGLKPIEAAYIMNIKPSPRLGYKLFKNGALTPFWRERSQMIKRKLLRSGRITQEQADEMTPESLYDRFKPEEPIEEMQNPNLPQEWMGREQRA